MLILFLQESNECRALSPSCLDAYIETTIQPCCIVAHVLLYYIQRPSLDGFING